MKIVIDIPESAYKAFKEWHKNKVATVEQSLIANGKPYEDRPKGDWIPVGERLPDESEAVLVWCPEYKNIYCAYFDYRRWWVFGSHGVILSDIVTAWKPLPKAPKEEDNDG